MRTEVDAKLELGVEELISKLRTFSKIMNLYILSLLPITMNSLTKVLKKLKRFSTIRKIKSSRN